MNLFGFKIGGKKSKSAESEAAALFPAGSLWGIDYDGEQDPGQMGNLYVYDVDYYTMAKRAYTLVTINEFAKTGITRLTQFAVATGLKCYPEPSREFLKEVCKIELPEDFGRKIQIRWSLFEQDKNISITKDQNLQDLARTVYTHAKIAGDVLVIKRVVDGFLEYQVINGLAVKSSLSVAENGNKIIDGVEIDEKGKHIAYYVMPKDSSSVPKRIPARDGKDRLLAWLVYNNNKRINGVRGYSEYGAIMQKLHKIGEYANAEVIAANTNAKFAVKIEQSKDSTGVNPFKALPAGIPKALRESLGNNGGSSMANKAEIDKFVKNLKMQPSAIAFHVPVGQHLESFDTKRPNVNYANFLDASMKYNYASIGCPLEIALLVFQNNYSASRASLKMFEMILKYDRKYILEDQFYQIIYSQFFELECLKGNIDAPKYLQLKNDKGYIDNAYTKAKFVGASIPHVDEVKEVNAVISKLKAGLITYEQAAELLGNPVDFDSLLEKRKAEEKKIKDAGLTFEGLFIPDAANNDETENSKDK